MPIRDRDYFLRRLWGGKHPPACTCVACNDRRLQTLQGSRQTPTPRQQSPTPRQRNPEPKKPKQRQPKPPKLPKALRQPRPPRGNAHQSLSANNHCLVNLGQCPAGKECPHANLPHHSQYWVAQSTFPMFCFVVAVVVYFAYVLVGVVIDKQDDLIADAKGIPVWRENSLGLPFTGWKQPVAPFGRVSRAGNRGYPKGQRFHLPSPPKYPPSPFLWNQNQRQP